MPRRHVYGPVLSRRFGLSLGIDLLPGKVCSYDCGYCQIGPTTELTMARQPFAPPAEILAEVADALAQGPLPDVITLAGRGEPTLYRELEELLAGLRRLSSLPIALITNGSLLGDPEVARQIRTVDLLVPSLDAGDEETFRRVNRPHPGLSFDQMVAGLRGIVASHPGEIRLEVMLCAGLNDDDVSLAHLARLLDGLPVARIEINTPVRPVAARGIQPCSPARLEEARRRFGDRAVVLGSYTGRAATAAAPRELESDLRELLGRHPCRATELGQALGVTDATLQPLLAELQQRGELVAEPRGEAIYYRIP